MADKLKFTLALLMLAAGVAGFYLLGDKPMILRVPGVLGLRRGEEPSPSEMALVVARFLRALCGDLRELRIESMNRQLVPLRAFATIEETTVGDGKVIPSSQVQVVQNLEGGIVSEIRVKVGLGGVGVPDHEDARGACAVPPDADGCGALQAQRGNGRLGHFQEQLRPLHRDGYL